MASPWHTVQRRGRPWSCPPSWWTRATSDCREELAVKFAPDVKNIEVARYEPAMHVTPNAVALKDD